MSNRIRSIVGARRTLVSRHRPTTAPTLVTASELESTELTLELLSERVDEVESAAIDADANLDLRIDVLETGLPNEIDDRIDADLAHLAALDPHPQYQRESDKDAAGGYAGLDGASKLSLNQVPAALTTRTIVQSGSIAAVPLPSGAATMMLTLPGVMGAFYEVFFTFDAGNASHYATARIVCGAGGLTFGLVGAATFSGGAFTALTVDNAGNVKLTQASGGSLNVSGGFLRMT